MTQVAVISLEDLEALVERAVRKATAPVATDPDIGDVMTREQAAKFLHVNPHQMPKLIKQGLPAHPFGTGDKQRQWRFLRSELMEWLTSRKDV